MSQNRFVNRTLSELREANRSPIFGYEDSPFLTLEETAEKIIPFVPSVIAYVMTAKNECNQYSDLLTRDESAAIYLYSMPSSFFSSLNDTLRDENRHALKPWFAYLKLFMTALKKLPSIKTVVWRGVYGDVSSVFASNNIDVWWSVNSTSMDLKIVQPYLGEHGTLFAIEAICGRDISQFSAILEEREVILMPGTYVRAKTEALSFKDCLFVVHLDEVTPESESQSEPNHLFEWIKQEYRQNGYIERLMNPAKFYPIEQSYINLALVETKKQQQKERQLRDASTSDAIMGSFEEIYGTKTTIDVKNIFEICKNQEKKVLVFGRAGIGKSTFCRYIVYQWAMGSYWTENTLMQKKTLWILDGYDEIVQNVPLHLECLFEQLLKTPHHILTSRPYQNVLAYHVQMEITGFTDHNIKQYVKQFFNQMEDELDNSLNKGQTLFRFLKTNRSIWGVAHIPVNLELICSLWSNEDSIETKKLTITSLYTMMIEWLCRRYLSMPNKKIQNLSKDDVNQRCEKELAFLENLAFNGMESNTIILRPNLLKKALNEEKISLHDHPHILNMGILKSFNKQGIDTQIEMDKDHYFVHLSFQEYFTARYLIKALRESSTHQEEIKFIQREKYNQRYALMLIFLSGLSSEADSSTCLNMFWRFILTPPMDLLGIRHMQLVISCLEETSSESTVPQHTLLIEWIAKCIKYSLLTEGQMIRHYLAQSLRRAPSVVSNRTIINVVTHLLQNDDSKTRIAVLSFVSGMNSSNLAAALINLVASALDDKDAMVRRSAYQALGQIGEKVATNEVITKLVSALEDESEEVVGDACLALGYMGEKAATYEVITNLVTKLREARANVIGDAYIALEFIREQIGTHEMITKLVSALEDESEEVRYGACETLGNIGEKAATNEVITKLVSALEDESEKVRHHACQALGNMGENAVTNEVITKLLSALADEGKWVRCVACKALGKMGEKAGTNEVIIKLVNALEDESEEVRSCACQVLRSMGKKAATNEVITKLVNALEDKNEWVRRSASEALENMGKKAATNEVITKLVNALEDKNEWVRCVACKALGKMCGKAATTDAITKLVSVLEDERELVRDSACQALGKTGDKAATNEVITKLISALEDENRRVRESASQAVGKMGETAGTNEVMTKLVSVLEDESYMIRECACQALWYMGEKAATHEVITKLVSALEDEREWVRDSACQALWYMGEKAATNEVIIKLASRLEDASDTIRWDACQVLGRIGEKAGTNEVITKLVNALEDKNEWVRRSASEALGNIGKKAATHEVITKLVSALEDEREWARRGAFEALGNIGEKAATDEVITKLVSALEDKNEWVRRVACEALGKMGEKAVTNEVITKLISALEDEIMWVRCGACEALGKMGEKAATNEVITKLISALEDKSERVRGSACQTFRDIGEKAATNEVIAKLVSVLGDKCTWVRSSAYEALGKMDEKRVTNEVITMLTNIRDTDRQLSFQVACPIDNMFGSSAVMVAFGPKLISKLCVSETPLKCLKNVSLDELIRNFFDTQDADWLFTAIEITLQRNATVSIIEDKLMVYENGEPVELRAPNLKLHNELIKAFTNKAKALHLSLGKPSKLGKLYSYFWQISRFFRRNR
ncbi:unnamed protein product [Adineta steineri]|uniref:NAD(P)(+)--arginine ADP-ribosyltransferase n=1 Tax=Adineta steineri TaxID=433720 RepID=A0A819SKK3_9BILA|nr:unnamed protein product [Adineta steineri]